MSDTPGILIDATNLSKIYRIPESGHHNFTGSFGLVWNRLMGQSQKVPRGYRAFPALKPMDLKIQKGESVGIIGRNGSGKSTLLQLIAGTLPPTTGRIGVHGSVSALLELGSGFSMEYTGMENIFLNGAILGLSRRYLENKLAEILEFADIGDFIHQPLKTYSSGMRIRLAFSVLATVRPDVLIIDEALSVGDIFFQSKCSQWLENYVSSGGSLICVSHDMFLLQRLCQRGILMEDGAVALDGSIADAANLYYKLQQGREVTVDVPKEEVRASQDGDGVPDVRRMAEVDLRTNARTGDQRLEIKAVRADRDLIEGCKVGDWLAFEIDVVANASVRRAELGVGLRDRSGQLVAGYHTHFTDMTSFAMEKGKHYTLHVEFHLQVQPSHYLLLIGLGLTRSIDDWEDFDILWDCSQVVVRGEREFWGLFPLPFKGLEMRENSVDQH